MKPETLDELTKEKDYKSILDDNYKKILNHREYLITQVFNNDPGNNINYPVHIQRIIQNTVHKKKNKSDISPLEILESNENLINKCFI